MNIRINRSSQTPIYLQIKCAIQNLILSGELSPGYKMPAERKLARELDIHRNTVIKAYGELVDEGYLIVSSKRPKGYFVKEIADDGVPFKRFFPAGENDSLSFYGQGEAVSGHLQPVGAGGMHLDGRDHHG